MHMLIFYFSGENTPALNLRACSEVIIEERAIYFFKGNTPGRGKGWVDAEEGIKGINGNGKKYNKKTIQNKFKK